LSDPFKTSSLEDKTALPWQKGDQVEVTGWYAGTEFYATKSLNFRLEKCSLKKLPK
jgi:hypothetical protein